MMRGILAALLLISSAASASAQGVSPDPETSRARPAEAAFLQLQERARGATSRRPENARRGSAEYANYLVRRKRQLVEVARSALDFFDQHPTDHLRWDAIAIAYGHANAYAEISTQQRDDGVFRDSESEIAAAKLRLLEADEFTTSATYRRIRALVDLALVAPDVHAMTYAQIVASKVSFIRSGDYPSYVDLVNARVPRPLIEPRLVAVRRLIDDIDARFRARGEAVTPHSYGSTSADSLVEPSIRKYLRMVARLRPSADYVAELDRLVQSRFPRAAQEARASYGPMFAYTRRFDQKFTALDGRTVHLAEMRGKVLLLHFWSTSCKPCVEALASTKTIYEKYRNEGFEVVGVSLDAPKDRKRVEVLCARLGIEWPQYFDGAGAESYLAVQYGISQAPAMLLVNKEGVLVSTDVRDASSEREVRRHLGVPLAAEIRSSIRSSTSMVELVPFGSDWSYLDGDVVPPDDWNQQSTPARGWKRGAAKFGYGNLDETTVVSFGPYVSDKAAVTYFRREFEVAPESAGKPFLLRMRVDDGAAAYVNGAEIGRVNLPEGHLEHQTLAIAKGSDDLLEMYGPAGLLRAGRNVIAVRVHQEDGESADLSFDLQLSLRATEAEQSQANSARTVSR